MLRTFEVIPELASAGAFAGANALYLEHIENPMGRFSLDIDLQNQTDEIEAIHRRLSPRARKKLKLVSRLSRIHAVRLGSDWVGLERSTGLFRDPANAGRRFIPLLLADCKLPDTLRRYKYVDYREDADAAFQQVVSGCTPARITTTPTVALHSGVVASLSNPGKYVEPVFPTKDKLALAPLELRAKLEAAPPLQLDEIKKPYKGLWVDWLTSFSAASKHLFDPEICCLQLEPTATRKPLSFVFCRVHCRIKLADYPKLKALPVGAQVRVIGQIADFDLLGVSLVNVRIEIPSGAT